MLFNELLKLPESQRGTAFRYWIHQTTREKRIPNRLMIELTQACTLKCCMCYNKHKANDLHNRMLSAAQWYDVVKAAYELGTRNVTLTGGECMLFPDFVGLYEKIYNLGIDLSIITNATMVTAEILEVFRRCPPKNIYVTIYGMSEKTYEKVCGNGGAFEKVIQNTDALFAAQMPVVIQTTVTRHMQDDVLSIFRYAKKHNAKLRISTDLIADKELNGEIPDYFLSQEEIDKLLDALAKAANVKRKTPPLAGKPDKIIQHGMQCGAGRNSFCIDCGGNVRPCVAYNIPIGNVLEFTLKELWLKVVKWADYVPQLIECQSCAHRHRCKSCVMVHYNDMGEYGVPSPRLCWKRLHPDEALRVEKEWKRKNEEKSVVEDEVYKEENVIEDSADEF